MAVAAIFLAGLSLASPLASGQGDTYLQDVAVEFEVATVHLDEAAEAIARCNDALIACLQEPEPTAGRLDNASVGLEAVLANLTNLDVPSAYASSHALLETGFQQVIDGLRMYAQGLRQRDVDTLSAGADLVREGRNNISTANNAIFGQAPAAINLLLILIIAVFVTAAAVGVLVFIIVRDMRRTHQGRVRNELATCPTCGAVLDRWWTYRGWQIRQWRSDHLKAHEVGGDARHESRAPPSA